MGNRWTRRDLLKGAATLAAAGSLPVAMPRIAVAAADFTTRQAFDAFDLGFNDGNGRKTENNDYFGPLGWGESYVLQAYLLMFEAHGDEYYVDKAIDHIDHVLANRDTERGVLDWRGMSLPGWRIGHPYSCGELVLHDADGRDVVRLRSARAYPQLIEVTVGPGTQADTFRIDVTHPLPSFNVSESHDNLTMDPASTDYVVTRLYDSFTPTLVQLTARDLRESGGAGGLPVPVQATMEDSKFHSSVHTGQIAYPIAKCARLILTTPQLRSNAIYRARADEYVEAAAAAAHIHDDELRANDGEAWYEYNRGAPVNLDGSDLPHNYAASMARVWLELFMASRGRERREYRDRAEQLVRMFRNDLTRKADGTASWTYYWTKGYCYSGWSKEDDVSENFPFIGAGTRGEDISHGHLEITMAETAHRAGVLFNAPDMRMLARTLTDVIFRTVDGEPSLSAWVDGSGDGSGYRQIVAGWLGLAPFDQSGRMVSTVHALFSATDPVPNVLPIYASAWLNWAVRRP